MHVPLGNHANAPFCTPDINESADHSFILVTKPPEHDLRKVLNPLTLKSAMCHKIP